MKSANTRLIVVLILIAVSMMSSFALGIAPSRQIVDFNSDLNREFNFNVVNSEHKDMNVEVYPRGELADYVSIENKNIHFTSDDNEVTVNYRVDIPYSARKPGDNIIEIVIEEQSSNLGEQTTVGAKLAVVQQLILRSPRDGTYARVVFSANNPEDLSQAVQFTYTLFNEGTEDISSFDAELNVYDSNNELVDTENYKFSSLASGEYRKETRSLNKQLPPGDYRAVSRIVYEGKTLDAETSLKIGGAYIEIEGISSPDFTIGKVSRLDISIYNMFYQEIKHVFAEVVVKDESDKAYSVFKTTSVNIQPASGDTLYGYWDTSGLSEGKYNLLVRMNYNDKIYDTQYEIQAFKDKLVYSGKVISGNAVVINTSNPKDPIIPILIVTVIALIIVTVYLIFRIKKNPPQINNMVVLLFVIFITLLKLLNSARII